MKLGDYVHTSRNFGYAKFGLKYPDDSKPSTDISGILGEATGAIKKEHDAIRAEARTGKIGPSDNKLKEIEATFDYLYNGSQAKDDSKKIYEQMGVAWKEYIDKAMDEYVSKFYEGLSFDNGVLHSAGVSTKTLKSFEDIFSQDSGNDKLQTAIAQARNILKGSKVGQGASIKLSSIEGRLKGMNQLIEKGEGIIKKEDLKNLEKNRDIINKYYEDLKNKNLQNGLPRSIMIDPDDKELKDVISAINFQAGLQRFPTSKEIGEIWEVFGTLMSGVMSGAIDTTMTDTIDKLVENLEQLQYNGIDIWTGKKTDPVTMGFKGKTVGGVAARSRRKHLNTLNNSESAGFKWEYNNGEQQFEFSQQSPMKADFKLFYDPSREPLAVSAKNYSLKSSSQNIQLVQGTSFLQLLQSIAAGRYEAYNHWLNLGVLVQAGRGAGSFDSVFNAALDMVKCMIISKSLTGNFPGRVGKADYFLVNARKGNHKGVHLVSMNKLISNLETSLDNYIIKGMDDIFNPPAGRIYPYADYKGHENSGQEAYRRIAEMIRRFATYKITVYMKQKGLDSF